MRKRLPATPLFHSSGVPTRALTGVLEECGINESDPHTIRDVTQRAWRKHDLTASQIEEEDAHLRDRLLPHFRQLGLIGIPRMGSKHFPWCAILGATYTAMHKRIAAAKNAFSVLGVRWMNTAYLVSTRPLYADKESPDVLSKPVEGGLPFCENWESLPVPLPKTEADLPTYIGQQIGQRPWDTNRERIAIGQNRADGRPAGTIETFHAFANTFDPRGDGLLIISSQPHMLRQCIEASQILGDRFERYAVTGYDLPGDVNVTKCLDELAKLIYDIVGPG